MTSSKNTTLGSTAVRIVWACGVLFSFATLMPVGAVAQSTYPNKPIQVIVPFPPGGSADTAARQIVNGLSQALKQPIVIQNRVGAGGALGTAFVANAEPDGYTLLMGLSSIATTPESDRLNGRKPSYEMKQLAPVARIAADPLFLVVKVDSKYRSVKEIFDEAKRNPTGITYASSGVYGPNHVAIEMLAQAAGVKMLHVPYAGGAGTVTALMGNQVDFTLMAPSVASANLRAGKIKALAVYSAKRLSFAPDVPTLSELGYDVNYSIWAGIFAPAGTSPAIVNTLSEAAGKVLSDTNVLHSMAAIDMPAEYLNAADFRKFVDIDSTRLIRVVRAMGKVE